MNVAYVEKMDGKQLRFAIHFIRFIRQRQACLMPCNHEILVLSYTYLYYF